MVFYLICLLIFWTPNKCRNPHEHDLLNLADGSWRCGWWYLLATNWILVSADSEAHNMIMLLNALCSAHFKASSTAHNSTAHTLIAIAVWQLGVDPVTSVCGYLVKFRILVLYPVMMLKYLQCFPLFSSRSAYGQNTYTSMMTANLPPVQWKLPSLYVQDALTAKS